MLHNYIFYVKYLYVPINYRDTHSTKSIMVLCNLMVQLDCGSARRTQKYFANEPEGLQHLRDHSWKALGEENPNHLGLFLFRHYFESYIE